MTLPAPPPSLYLVDASIYVFRAWHSLPDQFQDAQGWPTNAVHGFARFLLDLLEREKILVVHGTGFNWPTPDHLRIVTLPWGADLRAALERMGNFLSSYRQ